MQPVARTKLVMVDPRIRSAYPIGGTREEMKPASRLGGGLVAPDMAAALLELHLTIESEGGDLRWTDLLRSSSVQAGARAKYERWLDAGKPKPGTAGFISAQMKAAFVARPGGSFHEAGRAGDVDHMRAAPDRIPRAIKLDWLWARALPLGFRPAIKAPDEGAKEAWHLDFMGEWLPVYERLGYEQAAKAAILDVGLGWDVIYKAPASFIQAQLHRAGFDVGTIDGSIGAKTRAGLRAAGIIASETTPLEPLAAAVACLPSRSVVTWRPA